MLHSILLDSGIKEEQSTPFPGTKSFFLLQHALQCWFPPFPLIRKLGIRIADEISSEKIAIEMIRGDFSTIPDTANEVYEIADK